ncbi:MAG: dihydroorotate dehydrogenase electron transfer subunit, partial [Bacilli bacterium]
MICNEQMTVTNQEQIAKHIYKLTLRGELVNEMKQPGQFVHLRVEDSTSPLLRRPISICEIDPSAQTFTMIYRAEGKGTVALSKKTEGDTVDVLGPLGEGFPVEAAQPGETALLVGGGIGVPPLYELAKRLNDRGVRTIAVLGFQSEDVVFYEEEFNAIGETYIVTVDGTRGSKGFVTDVICEQVLNFDLFYSCGPTPMLKALSETYSDKRGFISLEERMGCGIGACFACVCRTTADPTGASYVKVCSDGPV